MELDKNTKIFLGSVVGIGIVLPTILFGILLVKIGREMEKEEHELEEAEPINDYQEYERPTGYKSKTFNVFQANSN